MSARADYLWMVRNVAQENAVKGSLRGLGRDDLSRLRATVVMRRKRVASPDCSTDCVWLRLQHAQ